jgi:hypothetical protein
MVIGTKYDGAAVMVERGVAQIEKYGIVQKSSLAIQHTFFWRNYSCNKSL